MNRGLFVVDDSDAHRTHLKEAGALVAGVGAELVLLSTMTQDDVEENLEKMDVIADVERTSYSIEAVLGVAEQFARELASEVLADHDVEYDIHSVVSDENRAETILETAAELECDHIFLVGQSRTPTGKAIFGDTAQAVILNFDGAVTITMIDA